MTKIEEQLIKENKGKQTKKNLIWMFRCNRPVAVKIGLDEWEGPQMVWRELFLFFSWWRDLNWEQGREAGIFITIGSVIPYCYAVTMRDSQREQSGIRYFISHVTSLIDQCQKCKLRETNVLRF